MMDAPGPEPTLRDLEAAPLAEEQIARRHAYVLKQNLGMPVRRVVVPEYAEEAHNANAQRVHRHQDYRLLLVRRRGGIGFAHENANLAARIAGAGGPPLASI